MAANAGAAGAVTYDGAEGFYVDPSLGNDQNPGTRALPFQTIEKAASRAQSGQTVWLFDGEYSAATEPRLADTGRMTCAEGSGLRLAAGVTLAALGPGRPKVASSAHAGLCLEGGAVRNIDFVCVEAARAMNVVLSGQELFEGCSFTGCTPALTVDNGTTVVRDLRDAVDPNNPNDSFAEVGSNAAELTIEGGTVVASRLALRVLHQGKLTLSGVNVVAADGESHRGTGIAVGGPGSLRMVGGTISGFSEGIAAPVHDATIEVKNTTFSNLVYGYRQESVGNARVSFSNVEFRDLQHGIDFYSIDESDELIVSGGSFHDLTEDAIRSDSGMGTIRMNDVAVYRCGVGARFTGTGTRGETELSVTLRNVSITECPTSGIQIRGNFPVHYDFGTVDSPGGNTFTGNGLSGGTEAANLYLWLTTPEVVYAVGNTWDPDVQGADSSGHFGVTEPGAVLEITTGAGQNFRIDSPNLSSLRLAENAN